MLYTRKRALLACDFCRHRKRRCDGKRPCSTCTESNADCRYKDLPVDRLEPPPGSGEAVTEQLNRIESMLRTLVPGAQSDVDSPEASDAQLTHTRPSVSVSEILNSTTSPPVPTTHSPGSVDSAHTQLQAYDPYASSFYSDDTLLPFIGGTSGTPIISLSPAPPVPATSMSPIPTMASMSSISLPSLPSLPSLSLSSVSSESQASMFDMSGPEYAFPRASFLGQNLLTSSPTDMALPHTAPLTFQRKRQHYHNNNTNVVIPRETATAADSFLSMPDVVYFISPPHGRDAPLSQTHFYDIEARLPLQKELQLVCTPALRGGAWPLPIADDTIGRHVAAYFEHVHPGAPLVSHAQYTALSRNMFVNSDAEAEVAEVKPPVDTAADHTIEKAICLTIWALGALTGGTPADEQDALRCFQPAFEIIQHHALWAFGPPSLAVCQALLLAASYFAHVGRPLYNARLVDLAGRQLVRLARDAGTFDAERGHAFLVAFWVCFLWESDRAAEFDTPLNVTALADTMIMPTQRASDDATTMIFLSAEIAARKIANETRKSLYGAAPPPPSDGGAFTLHKRRRTDSDDGTLARTPLVPSQSRAFATVAAAAAAAATATSTATASANKTLTDSTELSRQLDDWYKLIPGDVRPPLRGSASDDTGLRRSPSLPKPLSVRAQILRAQYYATRHIIHRPFVLAVASQQRQQAENEASGGGGGGGGGVDDAKQAATKNKNTRTSLPPAILEKCAICADACLMFLTHVLPLLDHRSPYLWTLCQTSVACLVVLLVVQACPPMGGNAHSAARQAFPGGKVRRVNIARLRDQVASKLRRWATAGSSFEAELQLIQNLPMPASDADIFMIPANLSLAGPTRLGPEYKHE